METLYDIGSGDLKELWDSDLEPVSYYKYAYIIPYTLTFNV